MPRWMIAVRGVGLMFAVPAAMFTMLSLATDLLAIQGSNRWADTALICCACATLLLLNAALLSSAAGLGMVRLVIADVILAPSVALLSYMGSVDPVALFLALPLLAGVIVMLGVSSCPLRRFARAH
ncbi:hypothetical protein [Sphingomonas sp. 1P08PE]|uniref:hypothetical protein n=1 Tax=Sphingomonas sp. 1P08PE TaxID=554122 RepID=UPI0039A1EC4F